MSGHILLDNQIVETTEETPRVPPIAWTLLAGVGAIAAVVGLADVALEWRFAALGNIDWEFQAIENTFANLLLGTVGLALLGAGLLGHGFTMASKLLALILMGIGAFLVGILLIYLLDASAVRTSRAAAGLDAPATVTTAIIGSTYVVAYWWGVWFLRTRAKRQSPMVENLRPQD